MANANPIFLDKDAQLTPFIIPADLKNEDLLVSVTVKLLSTGWSYNDDHSVILGTIDMYPLKSPAPMEINLGKPVNNRKLSITSEISRFRNGSPANSPALVEYHLVFSAAETIIDDFKMTSTNENPAIFDSFIILKKA